MAAVSRGVSYRHGSRCGATATYAEAAIGRVEASAASGSPAQMEEAKSILAEARRKLYALLAEETETEE